MIVQEDFPDHWKSLLLAQLTSNEAAPLCVIRFWGHCQRRKSSVFKHLTPAILASLSGWKGDPQIWWDAMSQTFLDVRENECEAHDWATVNAALFGRWKGGEINKDRLAKQGGQLRAKLPSKLGAGIAQLGAQLGAMDGRKEGNTREGAHSGDPKPDGFNHKQVAKLFGDIAKKLKTNSIPPDINPDQIQNPE